MIIGMGRNPFMKRLSEDPDIIPYINNNVLYIYPRFYDAKRLLLKSKIYWRRYLQKIADIKPAIALYPDYVSPADFHGFVKLHPMPDGITWIYPLHMLQQIDDVLSLLNKGYNIMVGYASGLNNYTLAQFYDVCRGLKTWYLGVSTKSEINKVLRSNFHGFDITTYALGSHKNIGNYVFVKMQLLKLIRRVQSKTARLF